jgi:hypothetical protein
MRARFWPLFNSVLCPVNLLLAAVNAIAYQEWGLAGLGVVAAVVAWRELGFGNPLFVLRVHHRAN